MSNDSFDDDQRSYNDDASILDGYNSDDVIRDNPYLCESHREYQLAPTSSSTLDPKHWEDILISDPGVDVKFSIDTSTVRAWEHGIDEIKSMRERLVNLVYKDDDLENSFEERKVSLEDLFNLGFGYEKGALGNIFARELSLEKKEYLSFLGTLFLQMSYKEAPSQLFAQDSELKSSVLTTCEKYMKLWKEIANKGRIVPDQFINQAQREEYLWMKCERACNDFLRDLSISGNNCHIRNSIDDDKQWLEQSGRNTIDDQELYNTTHNRDNRKGIIAHTDVSMPLLVPLCFRFQRKGETVVDCFRAIFEGLYRGPRLPGNLPDLSLATNHSDRGYTNCETIFDFMVPAGAEFTNTIKRAHPNPFLWQMKQGDNDTRTYLDEKGCPAIFLKVISYCGRRICVHAFRTGTKNISTVITSSIDEHDWEATALNPKQRILYEKDPEHGLKHLYFQMLSSSSESYLNFKWSIKNLFDELIEDEVDILTLSQGTVDWHRCRQFSFTSSQSDDAIKKAIVVYQNDKDWCKIGAFLEGENYRDGKSITSTPLVFLSFSFLSIAHGIKIILSSIVFGLVPLMNEEIAAASNENTNDTAEEEEGASEDAETSVDLAPASTPTQSMLDFFQLISQSQLPEVEIEAIAIIQDHLTNYNDEVEQILPQDLFTSSKSKVRKVMTNLLSS